MLRVAFARSSVCLEQSARLGLRRQWQPQRIQAPFARAFADNKLPDHTILPGSESTKVSGVPVAPILANASASELPVPKTPPSPTEVAAKPPQPSTNTGNLPPTGTGYAATAPAPAPKPRKRRRFRSFFLTLVLLSALGFTGGVYYSLVNDNFHDFFTEYVPFGEDVVGYFEEREFRKRFPPKETLGKNWPQLRGENKITIGKASGVNPRVATETDSKGVDLASSKKHVSAVEDAKSPKKDEKVLLPKKDVKSAPADGKAAPAIAAPLIDHVNVSEATEPAVQELVKLLNNIITTVNASPEASKYSSTLQAAKSNLDKVIGQIVTLRETTSHEAEEKIKNAHIEFDTAAKELVSRLEGEMREQGLQWKEEYENEREKLSISYQHKLAAELDAAKKVADEKNKNALLELEIALQKKFSDSVKAHVEDERSGRLSKLDELSSSVSEIEKLAGQWNEVVDATLQTQHLQVALEAVRAKLQDSEFPTPFINELVALKEVSKDNAVVTAAIASINPIAYQRGVPSAASLIDRFRRVATEVRKASLLPEDAGVASHAASAVLSRFMFQKKSERGLPEGDDVEATLARTEVLLEEGDLDGAAREMNGLKGWAGVLSKDWVGECRRVLEVRQAVEVMAAEARLQSLLVE